MDELEVRRRVLTDPYRLSAEVQQALESNAELQAFHRQVLQQDQQLQQALQQPVPLALQQRLLLVPNQQKQQQQKRFYQNVLGLAASVAFVAGFALNWSFFWYGHQQLGENSLAHVYHEEPYVKGLATPISMQEVNAKLASFNAQMAGDGLPVVYANFCNFRGTRSLHLVLETEQGQLTVFVVPRDADLSFDAEFADDKYHGRSVMLDKALLVLVAEQSETLQQEQQQLMKQLVFSV